MFLHELCVVVRIWGYGIYSLVVLDVLYSSILSVLIYMCSWVYAKRTNIVYGKLCLPA